MDRLTEAGASVVEITVPSVKEAMDLTGLLYSPEAYATWRHKIEKSPELMFSKILERLGVERMCLQQILFRLGKNYWIYESNIIRGTKI